MKKYDKSSLLKTINDEKEKKWDNRFTNLKITEYDSYKDINYLSLGLIKAKIKYEKEEKKNLRRAFSIKESILKENKNKLPTYTNENEFLSNRNIKNNLSLSKISPRNYAIKFNNNKNKKILFTDTIPNSCKREKNDSHEKHIIKSPIYNNDKNLANNKKPLTPLYRIKNYSFKEKNNNKNLNNFFIKDLLIKIKEDEEINQLYKSVKELWNNYGVTILYQNNFLLSLNDYFLSKKIINNFLNIEKNYMIKFKNEYSLIINKIEQRDNEINNIKKLVKEYSNKKDNKLESDIKNSLKLIRLYTINLVSQLKKFYLINSHWFLSGKIDLSKIKNNNYNLGYNYISNIKKDLNFLKYSSINNLYNFKDIGNDLFLLSLSDIYQYDNIFPNKNNTKYETLPITEEVYNQIIKLIYFINQIKIDKIIEKKNKKNNKYIPNNYSDNWLTINNELDIGNNYKGSINDIINQLKNNKKKYDKLFLNLTSNSNKKKRRFEKLKKFNSFLKADRNNKEKNINSNKEDIPLTTAEQLQNKFKEYEDMKQFIEE